MPETNPGLVQGTPVLSEFAQDEDMRDLVAMFVEELPEKIRALEKLSESRELDSLRRLAHQLRGACGGYGFPTVGAAAGKLEQSLVETQADTDPAANLPGIRSQVDELIGLCRRVRVA